MPPTLMLGVCRWRRMDAAVEFNCNQPVCDTFLTMVRSRHDWILSFVPQDGDQPGVRLENHRH